MVCGDAPPTLPIDDVYLPCLPIESRRDGDSERVAWLAWLAHRTKQEVGNMINFVVVEIICHSDRRATHARSFSNAQ